MTNSETGAALNEASHIAARSLLMDGYAVLTPDLYNEINALGKALAGKPFLVYDKEESSNWGECSFWASPVLLDARKLRSSDGSESLTVKMGLLGIANEVNVGEFRSAQRPEIDLSAIPEDRIHEYVALHEIGHVVDNYRDAKSIRAYSAADQRVVVVNEMLADRFAWACMYPGLPMPVRASAEYTDDWLAESETVLRSQGMEKMVSKERLSAQWHDYLPLGHVKKSIPWSRKLRGTGHLQSAVASQLRQLRTDYQAYDFRRFKREAEEMAAVWSEIARKPDAYAKELHRQHRSILGWKYRGNAIATVGA